MFLSNSRRQQRFPENHETKLADMLAFRDSY